MILNLFDRMKLPFRKNKEFLSALYDILGFYPHNIELYRVAFSHKSLGYRKDGPNNSSAKDRKDRKGGPSQRDRRQDRKPRPDAPVRPLNNERLEYLGDAVIESIVSDILFRHFPTKREGFLTSTRSKIVQRESLNRLATQMGLEKLILAAQGTHMSHTNIGGNAFEALMGAIYLDRGYKTCHWFISNRIIGTYIDLDNVAQKEVNFKSKLLEWAQKNRINTKFNDQSDGERGFHSSIVLEGITIGRGSGRSKKESQQEAAKEALTRMRREPKTYDSIFRSKEKRTAMEAEESFALPKIDEIEDTIKPSKPRRGAKATEATAPVLETKKGPSRSDSDDAYDKAYDASAQYEVIDTPPAESQLTQSDYDAMGLPAPPEENELLEADEKLRKKRTRNRGPKTLGDAVKGQDKGASTAEEKAARREAERMAEVERQRAKAERKRQEAEAAREAEAAAEAERVARQKAESKAKAAKAKAEAERKAREEERKARLEAEELDLISQAEAAKEALSIEEDAALSHWTELAPPPEKSVRKAEKPAHKAEKPAHKAEKPAEVVPKASKAKAEKSAAVAEEKQNAVAEEKPLKKTEKPSKKAEKPAPQIEKPAPQTEKPAPQTEKPAAQAKPTAVKAEKPAIASLLQAVAEHIEDAHDDSAADEAMENDTAVLADAAIDALAATLADETLEDAQTAIDAAEAADSFSAAGEEDESFADDNDVERQIQAFAQDVVSNEAPAEEVSPKAEEDDSPEHGMPRISFDEIVFSTEHDDHLSEISAAEASEGEARPQRKKQNRRRRRPNNGPKPADNAQGATEERPKQKPHRRRRPSGEK